MSGEESRREEFKEFKEFRSSGVQELPLTPSREASVSVTSSSVR
jgi:hypothetical protein